MQASEQTEPIDSTDPADPIDRIDPAEPIDKIDPVDPIDRIDPLEPMLRIDPDEPIELPWRAGRSVVTGRSRPAVRDGLSPLPMRPFSQQARGPGSPRAR
jgi:hypothetical protein